MIYFGLFFCVLLLTYGLIIVFLSRNQAVLTLDRVTSDPFISVLVVARNEGHNIDALLNSLSIQNYPRSKFEFLIFDDSSEDDTIRKITSSHDLKDLNFRLYKGADLKLLGKKEALKFMGQEANGELLLFTDADCVLDPNWIVTQVSIFEKNPTSKMICGAVQFGNQDSLFEKMMKIEFAALIQLTLGSISRKYPFMCNAANMAVRKSIYDEMQYEMSPHDLASGDDVFLLQAVAGKYGTTSIATNWLSIVTTQSPTSLKSFIQQRVRWAGKSSKSFSVNSTIISSLVLLVSAFLITLFVLSFVKEGCFKVLGFALLFKWIVDVMVLWNYRQVFSLFKGWLWASALLSLIYPFYVVTVALLSLKRSYLWKGRVVR